MPAVALRPIRPLPDLLVNQIAAGEVVERPASVVKELIENALDAGATRIVVELEQGGIELVRVSDDGRGIPATQLPLALAPHATSKIAEAADLERIATLGFRGEALASIASVSRLSIRSRTADETGASLVEAEGDRLGEPRPASGPVGTAVSVRNLFFNTPARRKFLRTVATEQARCLDAVRDLAMANPAVGFAASCDGRAVIDLPPGQSPRERALAVLGDELAEQLIEVHADQYNDARGLALWGLVGLPAIARATAQAQHVFLNGRVIRDKTVQHAIKEAYRGLVEPGRHPTAVLMLEMSPAAVDVNVHPSKVEVRFRDPSLVHSVVLRSIRDALRAADLTPTLAAAGPNLRPGEGRAILPPGHVVPTADNGTQSVGAFVEYFKRLGGGSSPPGFSYSAMRTALHEAPPAPPATPLPAPVPAPRVLQVHNTYLVAQDDQGVVIIDQHALHERVMFEHLLARVTAGGLESQRLLAPSVVPATDAQIDRLPQLAPLLERLGIQAEPIGPAAIGIHAYPTFLFDRGVDPVDFMRELLERADSDDFAPGSEAALREVLDMMACKAAVKGGDRLSEEELAELLRLREATERSSNCPHGRPTSIRLTLRELDRLFRRT